MSNDLYKEIKEDMVFARKNKVDYVKSILGVLISDIQRDPNKDYSNEKIIALISKTVKVLYDNHDKYNSTDDLKSAEFLERAYLPTQISESEIVDFLGTIDFSKLKNKMQAIGMVTKNFPKGSVDGKIVKDIVSNYEC